MVYVFLTNETKWKFLVCIWYTKSDELFHKSCDFWSGANENNIKTIFEFGGNFKKRINIIGFAKHSKAELRKLLKLNERV